MVPTHSGYTRLPRTTLSAPVATAVAAGGATITATIDYKTHGRVNVVGATVAGTVNITVERTKPHCCYGLIWMNNRNATVANTSTPVSCSEGYRRW